MLEQIGAILPGYQSVMIYHDTLCLPVLVFGLVLTNFIKQNTILLIYFSGEQVDRFMNQKQDDVEEIIKKIMEDSLVNLRVLISSLNVNKDNINNILACIDRKIDGDLSFQARSRLFLLLDVIKSYINSSEFE